MSQNSSPATRRWEGHDLVVIPVEILSATDAEGKPLSGTAVRLWIALATFANAKNLCWPSNRTLLALQGTAKQHSMTRDRRCRSTSPVTPRPALPTLVGRWPAECRVTMVALGVSMVAPSHPS